MDTRIGRFHCHYRVLGAPDAVTARLERLAGDVLPTVWEAALSTALGDDPAVYVFRRIHAPVIMRADGSVPDAQLVRHWGERLAGAVMRGIATDAGDAANLVRFADQADFVAHFIVDLLRGTAWERWYYGTFGTLRPLPISDALGALLRDNRAHLPAILRALSTRGVLDTLLEVLDLPVVRELWATDAGVRSPPASQVVQVARPSDDQVDDIARFITDLLRGSALDRWHHGAFAPLSHLGAREALHTVLRDNPAQQAAILARLLALGVLDQVLSVLGQPLVQELASAEADAWSPRVAAARPFFDAATHLVDRLGAWARARPGDEVLHVYAAIHATSVDWRDPRSLAGAVYAVLLFLTAQGYVRWTAREQQIHLARLDEALPALGWLDAPWLSGVLRDLIGGPPEPVSDLPLRPAGAIPTPKQRELMSDVAALLSEHRLALDDRDPTSPANALRLYAALLAHAPRWQGDATARFTIEHLLDAWSFIAQAASPADVLSRLQHRDLDGALNAMTGEGRAAARQALAFVAEHGDSGRASVSALFTGARQATGPRNAWIDSECAGVFLLLRAVVDARLAGLVERAEFPPAGATSRLAGLLAVLGLSWAGPLDATPGVLDPAISLLAGLEDPLRMETLAAHWTAADLAAAERFQELLLQHVAGQRLVRGPQLRLHLLDLGATSALVAGDASSGIWSLGRVIADPGEIDGTVQRWLLAWQQALGEQPTLIVTSDLLAHSPTLRDSAGERLVELRGGDPLAEANEDQDDRQAAAHVADRRALVAALGELDAGKLAPPDSDLTVSLTAIALLRGWARWLGPFATSSVPYLLDNLIRRPGRLRLDADALVVELASRPLDVVIEMAGYFAELDRVSWLGERRVQFRVRGA